MIEQVKYTYYSIEKTFEKQAMKIEDQTNVSKSFLNQVDKYN